MFMVADHTGKKEDKKNCEQLGIKFFEVAKEHEQGVKDIVVELYEIFHEAVEVSKVIDEIHFFIVPLVCKR